MNHQEPNDQAWELLKKAKEVEPSLFFVRNVVREARLLQPTHSGVWSKACAVFGIRGLLTGTAACAILAVSVVLVLNQDDSSGSSTAKADTLFEDQSEAFDPASEMAAVEYLGQLMAVADPGQLEDAALADLFF